MTIGQANRRRGRPRGFSTEQAAARAARLFWQRGYEGVSVDELTHEMGITTQSFYAAFGSKKKLHDAALDWYEREVTSSVRAALDDEPNVTAAIRSALRLSASEFTRADRPLGCMRSIAGLSVSRANEAVADQAKVLRRQTIAAIKSRLDRGVVDGQLSGDVDCDALSLMIASTVIGMSVAAIDGACKESLLSVADLASSLIRSHS